MRQTKHLYDLEVLFAQRLESFLEGLAKFRIEDRVDERVEAAVDISEPDEEGEGTRSDVADRVDDEQVVPNAERIDGIDDKKRNPAEQKDAYNTNTSIHSLK